VTREKRELMLMMAIVALAVVGGVVFSLVW